MTGRATFAARWVALVVLLVSACQMVSDFDSLSYKTAIDLRVESLDLIEKSKSDAPELHAERIQNLLLDLRKARDYEQGKGAGNLFSYQQWALLCDPDRKLVAGFLSKWQGSGRAQSEIFINEFKPLIETAFQQIIDFEIEKRDR